MKKQSQQVSIANINIKTCKHGTLIGNTDYGYLCCKICIDEAEEPAQDCSCHCHKFKQSDEIQCKCIKNCEHCKPTAQEGTCNCLCHVLQNIKPTGCEHCKPTDSKLQDWVKRLDEAIADDDFINVGYKTDDTSEIIDVGHLKGFISEILKEHDERIKNELEKHREEPRGDNFLEEENHLGFNRGIDLAIEIVSKEKE